MEVEHGSIGRAAEAIDHPGFPLSQLIERFVGGQLRRRRYAETLLRNPHRQLVARDLNPDQRALCFAGRC
jgi:hypothetical protein